MEYTIKPDTPGHDYTTFKVFADGTKVATLTEKQVRTAMQAHDAMAQGAYTVVLDYTESEGTYVARVYAASAAEAIKVAQERAAAPFGLDHTTVIAVFAGYHMNLKP